MRIATRRTSPWRCRTTGAGEPVLLLHGWPDTHDVWRHQVPALAAAGYRTIAPDLRGFGGSDKPADVASYGMLQMVGDLIGLLDRLGIERAHVVGHDWGGAIGCVTRGTGARPGRQPDLPVGRPSGRVPARRLGTTREVLVHAAVPVPRHRRTVAARRTTSRNLRNWAGHPDIDAVVARLPRTRGARPRASPCTARSCRRNRWSGLRRAAADPGTDHGHLEQRRPRRHRGGDDRHRRLTSPAPGGTSGSTASATGCSSTHPSEVNALLLDFLTSLPAPTAAYS